MSRDPGGCGSSPSKSWSRSWRMKSAGRTSGRAETRQLQAQNEMKLHRRLFTCLTILSLLLCLASVALLVRSCYWQSDHLFFSRGTQGAPWVGMFGISSASGELALFIHHVPVVVSVPYVFTQGWNFITRPSAWTATSGDKPLLRVAPRGPIVLVSRLRLH